MLRNKEKSEQLSAIKIIIINKIVTFHRVSHNMEAQRILRLKERHVNMSLLILKYIYHLFIN